MTRLPPPPPAPRPQQRQARGLPLSKTMPALHRTLEMHQESAGPPPCGTANRDQY